MTLSLLTYNLLHNKALTMLEKVVEPYSPDILLLQETTWTAFPSVLAERAR